MGMQLLHVCRRPLRFVMEAGLLLGIGCGVMLSTISAAETQDASAGTALTEQSSPVDWNRQISFEDRSLRIMKLKTMQDAMRSASRMYATHPLARYPDGEKTLGNAIEAIALTAVTYALNDPESPAIVWSANAAHSYGKKVVRGTGYGVDNPDNFYRMMSVDGAKRYEIRGYRNQPGPAMELFMLYENLPGMAGMNPEGAKVLAALTVDKLKVDADGRFVISIDSEPANGRPNHIQIPDTGRDLHLIVRDTLSDWSTEIPNPLRIVRIGSGTPTAPPSDQELAVRAADILGKIVPFWLQYFDQRTFDRPANQTKPLWGRAGGWGYASGGWFDLKADEALVITLTSMGARYLGFQLSDLWGVAPEYTRHTSSLTHKQARPNPDGTYTYVISSKDPGVWNWLDTVGQQAGIFAIRWQGVAINEAEARSAIRESKVVKLGDLNVALGDGNRRVDRKERLIQQKQRAAEYAKRLLGMPNQN